MDQASNTQGRRKAWTKAFCRFLAGVAAGMTLVVVSLPFVLRTQTRSVPLDPALFVPDKVHVSVFAHEDDEFPCAGVIQRQGPRSKYIWVTNGDGPSERNGQSRTAYAEQRKRESEAALQSLGKVTNQLESLGYSEREDHVLFKQLLQGATRQEALNKIGQIAERVYQEVKAAHPDILWTSAYQGGNPEHDLVNLLVCDARKRIEAEEHRHIPVLTFPEYQFTSVPPFIVPFRFEPWRKQTVQFICLDHDELQKKLALGSKYSSQAAFMKQFSKGVAAAASLNRFRIGGRKVTYPELARTEQYQGAPETFDHTKSPNARPWENYLFSSGSFRSTKLIAQYLQSRRLPQLLDPQPSTVAFPSPLLVPKNNNSAFSATP